MAPVAPIAPEAPEGRRAVDSAGNGRAGADTASAPHTAGGDAGQRAACGRLAGI